MIPPRKRAMPTYRRELKNLTCRGALPILIAITLLICGNVSGETFEAWMSRLPKQAKKFPGADDRYWRLWYERGFSPQFAWKNTDPKQSHNFSRPLLSGEKPLSR